MKTFKNILVVVLLSLAVLAQSIILTGCGTPTTRVTQVVGTVTITVDAAMNSWGAWVRSGKAPAEDRIAVRAAYVKYQNLAQVAEITAIAALNNPENQPAYVVALNALSAAHIELIKLIETLTKK